MAAKTRKPIAEMNNMKIDPKEKELLEKIRKWVELDYDATQKQRELELDDLRFCSPETQWDEADRQSRETAGRPVLTEDRLGPYLDQVINEQRKNKLSVQVNPVDNGGDVDTAEVIQGLIRHIEYSSNADTAYDTAFESAVRCGRGFYGVYTDYVDDVSLDQEIKIRRVENVHNVFIDPAAQEADFSDAKWGGYKNWYSVQDYKELYPNSHLANIGVDSWKSIGDDAPEWMSKDGQACLVTECYYKEFTKERLKNGREVQRVKVKWVKCSALEILESGEWPSKYIPIVPVLGKCVIQGGQRTWAGMIRAGKDPQKRHNYLLTAQTERIAFHPLATWIGPKGFMGKEKRLWNRAHKEQVAALEYEIVGDDGTPVVAPNLITAEAPIVAITNALMGAEEGMRAVMGMFNDPSRGKSLVQQSGAAIGRLQEQADTGNFHFQDNLSRAFRHEGRIILDLLPTVYDTERVQRIIGNDEKQKLVRINGPITDGNEAMKPGAVGKIYDLTTGKYDVTISSGPSYAGQRQEDRAFMMQMLQNQTFGNLMAAKAPDLLVSTMDSPIAKLLQDRLTPPEYKQQENGQPPIPPQIQQTLEQFKQQHAALLQLVQQLEQEKQSKQVEMSSQFKVKQLECETRIAIARIQATATMTATQAKINADGAEKFIDIEQQEAQRDYDQLQDAFNQLVQQHQNLMDQNQQLQQQMQGPQDGQGPADGGNMPPNSPTPDNAPAQEQ